MTDTDKERAKFEAHIRAVCGSEEYAILCLQRRSDGEYPTTWVQGQWDGWLAAKRDAIPAKPEPVGLVDDGGLVFWRDGKPPKDGSDLFAGGAAVTDEAKDAARWRELLECVLAEMPHQQGNKSRNAPGHGHSVPGIWDDDNGAKAGKECAWCKVWNTARAAIEVQRQGKEI